MKIIFQFTQPHINVFCDSLMWICLINIGLVKEFAYFTISQDNSICEHVFTKSSVCSKLKSKGYNVSIFSRSQNYDFLSMGCTSSFWFNPGTQFYSLLSSGRCKAFQASFSRKLPQDLLYLVKLAGNYPGRTLKVTNDFWLPVVKYKPNIKTNYWKNNFVL